LNQVIVFFSSAKIIIVLKIEKKYKLLYCLSLYEIIEKPPDVCFSGGCTAGLPHLFNGRPQRNKYILLAFKFLYFLATKRKKYEKGNLSGNI